MSFSPWSRRSSIVAISFENSPMALILAARCEWNASPKREFQKGVRPWREAPSRIRRRAGSAVSRPHLQHLVGAGKLHLRVVALRIKRHRRVMCVIRGTAQRIFHHDVSVAVIDCTEHRGEDAYVRF